MKNSIIIPALLMVNFIVTAQMQYPGTKKAEVTDTYWGVEYKDPYRWLEDAKNPEVIEWFKAQAKLSDETMQNISGRDELIAEWKKLDKLQPPVYYGRSSESGRVFYQKRMPGEKVSKVFFREGINGAEQFLFDPMTFIPGKILSVQQVQPSWDGKKLVIAYSESGAEVSTIQVMDVDTKKLLPDIIHATDGVGSWTFDNTGFLYVWIKSADNTDPTARLNPKTKLHKLGTDPTSDVDFFSNESYPELNIESKIYPISFLMDEAKDYVFGYEGSVQRELTIYYAPISELYSSKKQWKKISTADDKIVRGLEIIGNTIFAITYKNAKNYKLIATDLKNPDWSTAQTIFPERSNQTLESVTSSKDYLLVNFSDGINNNIYKYHVPSGTSSEVKLPFSGVVYASCIDNKTNDFTISITSWNKPVTEFSFNAETDLFSPSPFNKPSNYPAAYKDLTVEEVEVKGHDGVMIPLSIIYKNGMKKDGSNVCLMESYGAYGISMTPYFSVTENALAVQGVVLAFPHVRGGSEKGQEWYQAGYKTTKPNTWKDFISCAEYLIANGYTSSERLAGMGTSAGGIMISRAITERPELFAAAINNVGCSNTMRMEFSSNGPVNTPEFGTVENEEECRALYEMDGMHHVKEGTKYPAVMNVAGWNDPRVVAWQPGKFAAAMQNATTSGKPVLLKVNYDNGHFTEDRDVTYANFADQYAFVLWQCGHPNFQPKE